MSNYLNPYFIVLLSVLLLLGGSLLPLEDALSAWWLPLYFAVKMTILFVCLVPTTLAAGYALQLATWRLVKLCKLEDFQLFDRMDGGISEPDDFYCCLVGVLVSLLSGIAVIGIVTYLLGAVFAVGQTLVWGIVAFFSCFYFYTPFRVKVFHLLSEVVRGLRTGWADLSGRHKLLIAIPVGMYAIKSIALLDFQNHGDGYLYHLALSDIWLQKNTTGVVVENIYSGYALAIEHYYLFLKLLVSLRTGYAEQNALAQLSHFFIGFGCVLGCFFLILKKRLHITVLAISSLCFLAPTFLFFAMKPKNDVYMIAAVFISVLGIYSNRVVWFLLGAFVIGSTKVTGALGLIALGLACLFHCLYHKRHKDIWGVIKLNFVGVVCLLCGLLPFAFRNYLVTGNPLFPLLNEVFQSPFAPSHIYEVVTEMRPLSLGLSDVAWSIIELAKRYWLFGVAAALLAVSLCFKPLRKKMFDTFKTDDLGFLLCFVGIYFIVLQLVMGPYTVKFESRHYLAVFTVLIALSILLIYSFNYKERLITLIIAVAALSVSTIDVGAIHAVEFFRKESLTADLRKKKPLLDLNIWLDRYAQSKGKAEYLVFAFSESNTSYFLRSGLLAHVTLHFPSWRMRFVEDEPLKWRLYLDEIGVDYLMVQDGLGRLSQDGLAEDYQLLKISGNISLYQRL